MSAKVVLAHECGQRTALNCSCRMTISRNRARTLVDTKKAGWWRDGAGRIDFMQIVLVKRRPLGKPPAQRAQTIGVGHILKALGGGNEAQARYHSQRIACYGELSRKSLEDAVTTQLRSRRKTLGVSLDELAAVLGPRFSRARLSVAERGFIQLTQAETAVVSEAIERLGDLRSQAREIVKDALSLNFVADCADIRERAQSLQAAVS
jgi:hypothetical protein